MKRAYSGRFRAYTSNDPLVRHVTVRSNRRRDPKLPRRLNISVISLSDRCPECGSSITLPPISTIVTVVAKPYLRKQFCEHCNGWLPWIALIDTSKNAKAFFAVAEGDAKRYRKEVHETLNTERRRWLTVTFSLDDTQMLELLTRNHTVHGYKIALITSIDAQTNNTETPTIVYEQLVWPLHISGADQSGQAFVRVLVPDEYGSTVEHTEPARITLPLER